MLLPVWIANGPIGRLGRPAPTPVAVAPPTAAAACSGRPKAMAWNVKATALRLRRLATRAAGELKHKIIFEDPKRYFTHWILQIFCTRFSCIPLVFY